MEWEGSSQPRLYLHNFTQIGHNNISYLKNIIQIGHNNIYLHLNVIQIGHENIFDLQNTFIKSALDYIHSRKGLSWKASLSPLDRNLIRMNAAALWVLADVSNVNLSGQIIVFVLFILYFGW